MYQSIAVKGFCRCKKYPQLVDIKIGRWARPSHMNPLKVGSFLQPVREE